MRVPPKEETCVSLSRNTALGNSNRKHTESKLLKYVRALLLLLVAYGVIQSRDIYITLYYSVICVVALIPGYIWLKQGSRGVPVFSVFCGMHILYYAIPMNRSELNFRGIFFNQTEIRAAGTAVVIFLVSAVISWQSIRPRLRRGRPAMFIAQSSGLTPNRGMSDILIFGCLSIGILFYLGVIIGAPYWLGHYYGIARQIVTVGTSLGCFSLGYERASQRLRGGRFYLSAFLLVALLFVTWSSLFLVGGILFVTAALLGFVLKSGRAPIGVVAVFLTLVFVLHFGKGEMRQKYWTDSGVQISISAVPWVLIEWFQAGISSIETGLYETQDSVVDRSSLLHMVAFAQSISPHAKPFLFGKTYKNIVLVLVPRFVYKEKVNTQISQNQLNIYYGVQSFEDTQSTAIGWGTIAEAYANYGYVGVVTIGCIMGILCGMFERQSFTAPIFSLRYLLSVVAMMVLLNLEADLTYIVSNMWQALAACIILYCGVIFFRRRKVRGAS